MRFSVFGGGAWGTALAVHSIRAGHQVRLWVREAEIVEAINARRRNPVFLPGIALPDGLLACNELASVASGSEAAIVVVPSEFCRGFYRELARSLPARSVAVSATKGIEVETWKRMTEVAAEEAPALRMAVISGPSFALEVAEGQPTAVVLASREPDVAEWLQKALSTRSFRVYASDDLVGLELAGALKNVIAIAAGIVDGLGYGHNTLAALITRGLAEVTRLSVALGGRPETLAGLAGLGDLVLTCTGGLSRNRQLGQALGRGYGLEAALRQTLSVAEGVRTARAACALADRAGVDMPIARMVQAVMYEGRSPREGLDSLMLRSLKRE